MTNTEARMVQSSWRVTAIAGVIAFGVVAGFVREVVVSLRAERAPDMVSTRMTTADSAHPRR